MTHDRVLGAAGALVAFAQVGLAQGPPIDSRNAQPRLAGEPVASMRSVLIVPESVFAGFANGPTDSIRIELADADRNAIAGTEFDVAAVTTVNGVSPSSGGEFTSSRDVLAVYLDATGVVNLLVNAVPEARFFRLEIVDEDSNRATIDYRIDRQRPTLIAAMLDDTPGSESLDLVFDADLTNLDPSTRSASREFEEAEPRPIASGGPDNEINQTTAADIASLNDFELAVDADFTTPITLDGAIVSFPRLLDDRRTIRYDIDIPAAFDTGMFIRVASNEITSVTNRRATGAVMITSASRAAACPADRNADGVIDGADLGILLGAWGAPDADLTGDGVTDGADLGVLLGAWGSCE